MIRNSDEAAQKIEEVIDLVGELRQYFADHGIESWERDMKDIRRILAGLPIEPGRAVRRTMQEHL